MSADFGELDRVGLNLQAVLELDRLPRPLWDALRKRVPEAGDYRQLILVGNAGPRLWEALKAAGVGGEDPIDEFSVACVARWFAHACPGRRSRVIYPGAASVDLQALGALAGWHQGSPLRLGVMPHWGSWYAYRVALLGDTALAPSAPLRFVSPCASCAGKPCIALCPAGAMDSGALDLAECIAYRRRPDSRCAASCVARLACPVGIEQRYGEEQLRHSYSQSLDAIRRHFEGPETA